MLNLGTHISNSNLLRPSLKRVANLRLWHRGRFAARRGGRGFGRREVVRNDCESEGVFGTVDQVKLFSYYFPRLNVLKF